MAVEGAADVLQVLVRNLIDVSKNEISLIRGLNKEAQNLIQNLDTIQQFLNDAETQTIHSGAVKSWLKGLENVAFEADNVLDELHYHSLSKTLNKKKFKVLTCFSPFIHVARKRNMAVSIQEINTNLDSINEKATQLGLQKTVLVNDAPIAPDAGMETDSFYADPIFIGRDEVVSEIVEMLITSIATHVERVFSILPIVGMGGMGKTTLTRKVFHHQKMETQFGSRIWVHVSQVFDPINLFKKILEVKKRQEKDESSQEKDETRQEKDESSQEKDETRQEKDKSRDTILAELKKALKDKTYLLVLDDIWNDDVSKWEDFLNSLSGVTTTNGNVIIVTTRNTEVASIVSPFHIHHLNNLSEEDCWEIIRAKTFGNEDVPLDIESVGREIAKRCGGLPLAASVVGGVLRGKSVDKWLSIRQNWLSKAEAKENNITKILRLSFNNLSSPSLKKCFAYCSIFPKGEQMWKDELIEMWMGEGFLGSNEDMESVGDKFFNVLLHSSLLQVDKYGGYVMHDLVHDLAYLIHKERCVMHDLVHDLASSVLGSSNNADGITRVRYLFHKVGESSPITKEVAQHLRTLIYEADERFDDNIFSDFKSLHVLILKGDIMFEELPRSIRKLIHLRNLNISGPWISHLPDWIGELHHLQTLRAEWLKKLPSTIKYLINLRHLHAPNIEELPAEIGRLTSLQTIPTFFVRDQNGYKIEELGSLNNLKGSLKIRGLEKVHDKEEAEKANLSKKSKLSGLWLQWNSSDLSTNDENVLEGLQPHSNLKKLFISGFRGKRFPEWSMKMAVRNEPQGSWVGLNQLVEIEFNRCTKCEEIPMLGHLPNLKSLKIEKLSNVKSINSSFYGIGNETGVVFPVLETLELFGMDSLKEWAEVESGSTSEVKVFPNLQTLKISNCNQLMKVPMLGHLPNLKSLYLGDLSNVKSINSSFYGIGNEAGVVFPVLETLKLCDMDSLKEWAEVESGSTSEVKVFPHLQSLKISRCNQLMKVPINHFSSCLKSLEISGCNQLTTDSSYSPLMNTYMSKLTSLTDLVLEGLQRLPDELFYSNPNLSVLKISKCPELRELPDGLQTINSLKELIIEECPDLKRIGCSSVGSFTSLATLEIRECHGLMDFPYEMVESLALYTLVLKGLSSLSNLPRVIECLAKSAATLRNLTIVGVPKFMATSVEVWHFPNLWKLEIAVSMEGSRETSVVTKETVDRILQGCSCSSLDRLYLTGMEIWECLPESIQLLTSLYHLELNNFGMEELPEWFDRCISHTAIKLKLSDCKRLRRLPSTRAMRRLIEARRVDITGCPELITVQQEHGFE